MGRKSRSAGRTRKPSHSDRPAPLPRAAAHFAAGRLAAAEKCCRRALRYAPGDAAAWHLLAAILLARGDAATALDAAARAHTLAPDQPDYTNTLALAHERNANATAAQALWSELLEREPGHADAWFNRARMAFEQGLAEAATADLERALALKPRRVEGWKLRALCHARAGDPSAATKDLETALSLAPQDGDVLRNLAALKREAGDFDAAMSLLERALRASQDAETVFRFALLTPTFFARDDAIDAHRMRVQANLDALLAADLTLTDPAAGIGPPNFYGAYHGRNERDLMASLGRALARAWRPPPLPRIGRQPRPRVAFVSAHFRDHTIGRLYAPLFEQLPRDGYDVAAISLGANDSDTWQRIDAATCHTVVTPAALDGARRAVNEISADVIVYCDVGMDDLACYLAAERLAPVQCASWGHPVTTGLPTVDYFLSSELVEPVHADTHYTETLLQLPAWLTLYDQLEGVAPLSRAELGLSADERFYLCPQSLFKLHPDFDAWLGAVLARDPGGVVGLIATRADWRARLEQRFARLGACAERIRFIPPQPGRRFHALLASADVILDTIHFSGGYTSFEALALGQPLVTARGEFMRGRVSAGLCELVGVPQLIADDAAHYAELAVAIASDHAAGINAREAAAAAAPRLYRLDESVPAAYADCLSMLLGVAADSASERLAS